MGDPSLSTYIGVPEENNVNFDPFLPIGSEAIEIQANPYSYVGLTQNEELISSGIVDESGYVVLVFDPMNDPTTLDITITAQNQAPSIHYLHEQGLITCLGFTMETNKNNIKLVLSKLIKDLKKQCYQSDQGMKLVDGNGVNRLVEELMQIGQTLQGMLKVQGNGGSPNQPS